MSMWLSSHGAGAIKASGTSFAMTVGEIGTKLQPTSANERSGTILFPLPGLPRDFTHLKAIKVDFVSDGGSVTEITLMSGNDTVFQRTRLEKTREFEVEIYGAETENRHFGTKGLVVAVVLVFNRVDAQVRFRSVGLEVAVASRKPVETIKFDTGCWNITDVRPWDQPAERNEGRIEFSTAFSATPKMVISMSGASVVRDANFRVKVYATDVSPQGFKIHADGWGGTKLYSCGVSWMAIEV